MSRCKWLVTGMVLTSLIFMGGCASDDNFSGNQPVVKNNSTAALAAIIAPGPLCANGGIEVKTGIDTNGNGILDAGEILNTENVCNGTNGTDGTDGTDGTNGTGTGDDVTSLILLTDAAPADCANGGVQIDVGIDGNDDGLIDVIDPTKAQYVCNGADAVVVQTVGHATSPAKAVATVTGVTVAADNTIDVAFHVETADADAVTGVVIGDIRVYISDIVPAGTVTTNTPVTTFNTSNLERWAYERSSTAGAALDTTDAAIGDYVFNLVSTTADAITLAPEADLATHNQRVLVRVAGDDVTYNDTIALADFLMPAAGATVAPLAALSRSIVDMSACVACHNDPLQNAAHGGGYQAPDACVVCHTPLGNQYGDRMQTDGAWLASLIHKIHAAIDMPAFQDRISIDVNGDGVINPLDADDDHDITAAEIAAPGREEFGYDNVTYPKNIKNCEVCHFDNGQAQADAWKTNPTAEACSTCHDVTFGASATHTGGAQSNDACAFCHSATDVTTFHTVTTNKSLDQYGASVSIAPNYTATIALTAPANGSYYVAGETPVVTVTTDIIGADYTAVEGASYTGANLYVYGPRAKAVPVLTTGSTTDPVFIDALALDPTETPSQSHSMFTTRYGTDKLPNTADDVANSDANVLTDATGFKYQLQAIPADLAPGTYMVQVAIGHSDSRITGGRDYKIDGWALATIQIGTPTDEAKVAGECTTCHTQEDWGTMYHRSYFGTDGCLACHDQSGNHADPISNRVHAIHAASVTGDLLGYDWSAITFPQETMSCEACHNSGNTSYKTNMYTVTCLGCHSEATGAVEVHMNSNSTATGTSAIAGTGACIVCHGAGKSVAAFE